MTFLSLSLCRFRFYRKRKRQVRGNAQQQRLRRRRQRQRQSTAINREDGTTAFRCRLNVRCSQLQMEWCLFYLLFGILCAVCMRYI